MRLHARPQTVISTQVQTGTPASSVITEPSTQQGNHHCCAPQVRCVVDAIVQGRAVPFHGLRAPFFYPVMREIMRGGERELVQVIAERFRHNITSATTIAERFLDIAMIWTPRRARPSTNAQNHKRKVDHLICRERIERMGPGARLPS